IKAKVAKLPLYQLLGGKAREGVMVYGHAGGGSPQECLESVQAHQKRGYKVIRVQLGNYGGSGLINRKPPRRPGIPGVSIFEPTPYMLETPRLFEYLRKHLGDEVELCHDAHEQLTPNQAAHLAKSLEPYRLFFLEDVVRPDHLESFKMVREASTTSLAMGELFVSRWDCLPLFVNQWIDYIRIKPIHVGGVTEAKKIFTMAEPYQVKSASHGAADIGPIGQAASVHVGFTIPNFGVQEWINFADQTKEVFPGHCTYHDGYAYTSETPGHGVDIRENLAAKYPYRRAYMPLVRRADGTMHVY
ncbi:MAG: bifunctional D-altronate/D-mannonate dehydratase, partial [Planctomycetes bacterium]|nr:bifunctional D-altronate/D-mannonate dehydratase [Planctomycetota bacterium]